MAPCPGNPMRGKFCAAAARGLVLLLVLLVGCQQGNQQVYRDVYQRELRLQEDEIYRLEDCIQEYQGLIRGYRAELHEMRSRLDSGGQSGAALESERSPRSVLDDPSGPGLLERLPRDTPDRTRRGRTPRDEPPGIDVPTIDMGEPMDPPTTDPSPTGAPPIDVPTLPGEPADDSRYGPSEALPLPDSNDPLGDAPAWDYSAPTAALLPVEPLGDADIEGYAGPPLESGEPTLVALVRPASLTGEPIEFVGQASLMLMHPGSDRKLARWDFSPEEVADSWRSGADRPVLDLAIVLPDGAPLDEPLELWVRLVDQHGEKVLKRAELVLNRLASIDQAPLAAEQPAPPAETAQSVAQNEPEPNSQWRPSSRVPVTQPAPQMARATPSDSGWTQNDTPREPRKIELASHEERAAKPVPKTAEKQPAESTAPAWSPSR